jgi:histidinol-phosphate aminotransferase
MNNEVHVQTRSALNKMKPYTPGKPIWEVQRELGIERVIKLASNENPLGASPLALEAIQGYLSEIHRYPDASASDVRQTIASKLSLSAQQLLMTNGADELIKLVSEAYLDPGDEVIVPGPSFSEYDFGAQLMDAVSIVVPLEEDYSFHIQAILSAVTDRTKIVYICSPNNPTGTYLPKEQLELLLDSLPKRVLVVYDAAYSHYATAADYTNALAYISMGYPIIVLQTFSKIYGLAGIRIGFGAASETIIRQIEQVKEPFNVNTLAQTAAAAAIMDEAHVRASLNLNTAGREFLYEAFTALGLRFTKSMSNFILLELGPEAKTIYDRLLTLGVIVRYGGAWGLQEHVRITVGTMEENQILIDSLKDILTDYSPGL